MQLDIYIYVLMCAHFSRCTRRNDISHVCVCEFDELMWMIGPVDRKSQSIKVAEMHN